jgi:protein SCO1
MSAGDSIKRLLARPLFWALFLLLAFSIPIGLTVRRSMRHSGPPPLPIHAQIPDFTYTDQHGEAYGTAQLRGKVWAADFIFTRCPSICPLLTEKMRDIQHRSRQLGDGFHMVSFSVDPEYDTPQVLAEYARTHKVSQTRWTFLTGPFDQLRKTVEGGLKISMGRDKPDEPIPSLTHGTHFVLVDQQMRIRGFYDSESDARMSDLLRDAGLLMNRGY